MIILSNFVTKIVKKILKIGNFVSKSVNKLF